MRSIVDITASNAKYGKITAKYLIKVSMSRTSSFGQYQYLRSGPGQYQFLASVLRLASVIVQNQVF